MLRITEDYTASPQPLVMREMAMSASGGAPIQPGTSSQQATVTVVFEIK